MAWRQGLPYGQDLRHRVLARDAGQFVRAVAEARPMWRKPTGAGAAPGNRARDGAARARSHAADSKFPMRLRDWPRVGFGLSPAPPRSPGTGVADASEDGPHLMEALAIET